MRWGIAGFGWVARDFVAPAIRAAGHHLLAVADPSVDARAAANAFGAFAFEDYARLLSSVNIDALYVATPNHLHAPPAIAALEAGIPVLCEKPMAARLDDAEAIAAAAEATGTLYATAFDQRHHPAHRRMADLIGDGAIGRPVAVRIVYACWVDPLFAPAPGHANWRIREEEAGGGATIDLALHGLDLSQMLLGEPLEDLSIVLQRRIHDYAVDDGGALAGRFAGGALLTQHVAYNCAETLPRRRLEVLGETGLLTALDTMGQTAGGQLTLQRDGGPAEPAAFDDAQSPFAAQVAAFADAVGGASHDFSHRRDIALMRLFDAAHAKARQCL
ncbi:Gfo/Idh/MocA family protein [Tsuneonella amylolytica]|uniref:Gfo/Idh/MocA family protein n=1 Tax=Tsuneonella amylolytica TaxID=2338327 RepID=UPI000EA8AD63|nr:Gfo/Idh/MocA family oxidoreductase [Tsuneonella amylolytica]